MVRVLLGVRAYARHRGVSPAAVRKAIATGRIAAALVVSPGGRRELDAEAADRLWNANTDAAQVRADDPPEIRDPPPASSTPSGPSAEESAPSAPGVAIAKTPPSASSSAGAPSHLPHLPPAPGGETVLLESGDELPPPPANGRPAPTVKPGQDLFGDPLRTPAPAGLEPGAPGSSFAAVRAVRERWSGELQRLRVLQVSGELVSAERARALFFQAGRTTRDAVLAIPVRVAHDLAAEVDPLKVERRLRKELERALEALDDAPEL